MVLVSGTSGEWGFGKQNTGIVIVDSCNSTSVSAVADVCINRTGTRATARSRSLSIHGGCVSPPHVWLSYTAFQNMRGRSEAANGVRGHNGRSRVVTTWFRCASLRPWTLSLLVSLDLSSASSHHRLDSTSWKRCCYCEPGPSNG